MFPVAALALDSGGGTTGGGGTATPADGSILTSELLKWMGAEGSNEWQIVDGEYNGNAGANKTESGDGNVRVQKNVIPTDVENEFLVYLSIDTKQLFEDYFASAQYEATTSNNNHSEQLGTVVNSMTGNEKVTVSGRDQSGYNLSLIHIYGKTRKNSWISSEGCSGRAGQSDRCQSSIEDWTAGSGIKV